MVLNAAWCLIDVRLAEADASLNRDKLRRADPAQDKGRR
jgi:hypothetical protein